MISAACSAPRSCQGAGPSLLHWGEPPLLEERRAAARGVTFARSHAWASPRRNMNSWTDPASRVQMWIVERPSILVCSR